MLDLVEFVLLKVLEVYPEDLIGGSLDANVAVVAEHLGNGIANYSFGVCSYFYLENVTGH